MPPCSFLRKQFLVLDEGFKAVAVGVTTDEIDRVVHEASVDRNCYPSPLNYYQFPKSCCTSVNEVICHGIPDKRPLQVSFYNLSKNFIERIENLDGFPNLDVLDLSDNRI